MTTALPSRVRGQEKTVSPAASGVALSRVIWSPFSAAVTCRSNTMPRASAAPPTVAARTTCGPLALLPFARVPKSWTVTSGAGRARAAA